ncbi:hypothetical protein I3842_09G188900 [Carya illinoinensis]|uniref:Chloroplast lumen common family protein n=1 Tax=Carya illinoinensis TaxID=32201 RepID=A0A922E8K6_CARIL|nr:hypothetical protein I3842_09G188900 [Carya illinoinensis]
MESIAKLNYSHQPLHLSLNHHRPSFPRAFSSLSFRNPPTAIPPSSQSWPSISLVIKASSSTPKNPKSQFSKTLSPLVKTTCATLAAAAALFFTRFQLKPAIAAPTTSPMVEPAKESLDTASSAEEKERIIEEQLGHDQNDTEALRSLMEARIKARNFKEAIQVLDRLIELEPEEFEWPLLKANLHSYIGELELARNEFEEILERDPLRVEAYHGLLMVASEKSDEDTMHDITKRVEEAMEKCNKLGRKSEVRDFNLLVGQIRVMEGDYLAALKVYQQLVKEEPRDFRPYLCQGILNTMLGKKDEAEKHFEKFRRLVPKNHPYKEYFDENMFATKSFLQKVEKERAGSNR